jgi:hypothetical protein
MAEVLQANKEELLTLWLAEQVCRIVAEDKEIADKVLEIAKENLNKNEIRV